MITRVSLADGLEKQGNGQPSPRLLRAAHEFEGQMMKELLKPLTDGDGLIGGEDGPAGSGGVLGDYATEALGEALSERGGFGIANGMVRELSRCGTMNWIGKRTGNCSGSGDKSQIPATKVG
jgi:Rod binding domain-containing protein